MPRTTLNVVLVILVTTTLVQSAYAINGGTLQVNPRNSWRAFEVISVGEDPAGDNITYALQGTFDGLGAWLPDATTLRIQLNHETSDASVSEINLNLSSFQTAIKNTISSGTTGGVSFVSSAQQAYDRWSSSGGSIWINTVDTSNTAFSRFCSSQSHKPNTFGPGRGFVDDIYITGEEVTGGRLFALDSVNRDFYQLSGVTGFAPGGLGGMPRDPWENAALLDTGETDHVALLLSPDASTPLIMKLYIGQKGKDAAGNASSSFLARNGLAYGSYYYLNDTLPTSTPSTDGFFDTTPAGALQAAKLEDIDTNPNNPTQVVLGVQETGLFTFDFNLDFSGGGFSTALSSFSITRIQQHNNDTDGLFGDADNVDWTAATTLGGVTYSNGLIFVNEDSGTANGETWMMTPTGSGLTLIADTVGISAATETSGILDISSLVGYRPGSVLLTTNQGTSASLTVLINPQAAVSADFNRDGQIDAADYVVWRRGFGAGYDQNDYNAWRAQFGTMPQGGGSAFGQSSQSPVPEPCTIAIVLAVAAICLFRRPTTRRGNE